MGSPHHMSPRLMSHASQQPATICFRSIHIALEAQCQIHAVTATLAESCGMTKVQKIRDGWCLEPFCNSIIPSARTACRRSTYQTLKVEMHHCLLHEVRKVSLKELSNCPAFIKLGALGLCMVGCSGLQLMQLGQLLHGIRKLRLCD